MFFWQKASQLRQRTEWLGSLTFVVLAIQVPKDNDKTPQSAEQFFAALHGIYRSDPVIQEHVSFEIVAKKEAITFYVFTPLHLREFIEGQLYAQYPDLDIKQVPDYTKQVELEGEHVVTRRIQLTKEDVYPIKTFATTEVDPLAGITAVLSGLDEKDQVWLQIVVKPVGDEWQNRGVKYVQDLRSGKERGGGGVLNQASKLMMRVVQELIEPGSGTADNPSAPKETPNLSAPQEAALKGIESKITKLGFETIFRLVAIVPDPLIGKSRLQAVLAAFKQYNTTNLNGFTGAEIKIDDFASWEKYTTREFEEKGNILNIEELASVFHFPSQSVETSAISWAGSKKGEASFNLPLKEEVDPLELTILGKTDFRSQQKEFGIKLDDRMRHIYVIGKSGTGKSTLLENMVIDDINEGRGIIVVDPHGELADKAVEAIPKSRIKDVVIFDPADRAYPIAFNVLDVEHDDQKGNVASGFVSALQKIFSYSWGPRLEYILRNTTLALLDTEFPTILGIPQMLTNATFRNRVIPQIKDPVVLDFWKNEWANKEQRQQVEEMGSILNKVGQFLSTGLIRNIVGQPKSGFNIRKIMDEQKILIVNLSKGKIGEDNSALLGAMLITRVQLAAMSRADVPMSQRPPCFLYVDEFQNFATESFATILSEARKYNLGLTIAHQYVTQMAPEVKDAVFGNVGTLISFRVGAEDAAALKPEFAPIFDENDLVNLQRGHVYIKLLIDGLAVPAFSAQTFPPIQLEENHRDEVVAFSRSTYACTREEAEATIDETAGFRQRREAEEATRQAQDILTKGTAIAIQPPLVNPRTENRGAQNQIPESVKQVISQPVENVTVLPTVTEVENSLPVQVHKPVNDLVELEESKIQAEQGSGVEENPPKPPAQEKPLKVMDGWVYKEVAQKGGMRWFLGEEESVVKKRLTEKQRLKEENSESPVSPLLSEQKTKGEKPVIPIIHPQTSAEVHLQEGQSIIL